ncbi:hypothetical protein M407DRAFT_19296 [Tulasnella calospora MUT 4182]|uniref:Uncharacterized protein n=1 Tax=Tulasnella calospora MUT 4182 TaxID=1051891 RepID=A0A0C3LCZ7_9AGAM|nr:hypothetical protein M407DRAFT_19296 [Tulasnella calospora MUT 4182]
MASSEPAEEWLSFSGAPEEKAAAFIQNLNRRAFAQGKSKDDEWLAQYAAACLSHDALVWYYDLAEEVQSSWRKLCPALLREFSKKPASPPAANAALEVESDIMPTATARSNRSSTPARSNRSSTPARSNPTPAAAPAPAPAPASPAIRPPPPARSPRPPESISTPRIGYIELVDAHTGKRLGYINSRGDKTITKDINHALLVELPLVAGPSLPVSLHSINATYNDGQNAYLDILGLGRPSCWMIIKNLPGNNAFHLPGLPPTMTMSNVWTVHPLGKTLELKLLWPGRFAWEGEAYSSAFHLSSSADATPLRYQGPQRLYVGKYLPNDKIAKDLISSNPKLASEDMICAYKKAETAFLPGFRKVRMIFTPTD